ncbi:hypothetical protein Tco_0122002 [Tanacetum coccineum]
MSCLTTKGMHTIGSGVSQVKIISKDDDERRIADTILTRRMHVNSLRRFKEFHKRVTDVLSIPDTYIVLLSLDKHITAKVAGKLVSISEASIRTDLIFDDADGIDSLPNQAIFDAIQRMGYEGD